MAEQKTYVNGVWITEKQFQGGGSIIKMSIKADKLIEFLNKHKNEKGYVNINLSKRREVGERGETHTASLDTWKPSGDRRQAPQPQREQKPSQASGDFKTPPPDDDVPF